MCCRSIIIDYWTKLCVLVNFEVFGCLGADFWVPIDDWILKLN